MILLRQITNTVRLVGAIMAFSSVLGSCDRRTGNSGTAAASGKTAVHGESRVLSECWPTILSGTVTNHETGLPFDPPPTLYWDVPSGRQSIPVTREGSFAVPGLQPFFPSGLAQPFRPMSHKLLSELKSDAGEIRSICTTVPRCGGEVVAKIRLRPAPPPDLEVRNGERVNPKLLEQLSIEELQIAYDFSRGRIPKPAAPIHDRIVAALPDIPMQEGQQVPCGEPLSSVALAELGRRDPLRAASGIDDLAAPEDDPSIAEYETRHLLRNPSGRETMISVVVRFAYPSNPTTPRRGDILLADGTKIGEVDPNAKARRFARPSAGGGRGTQVEVTAPRRVQQVAALGAWTLRMFTERGLTDRMFARGETTPRLTLMPLNDAYGVTNPTWDHVAIDESNWFNQNAVTVPHELFHRVQYSYRRTMERKGLHGAFKEGGAVLASDGIDNSSNCYQLHGDRLFSQPDQTLADDESVRRPHSYAAGLFWKYFVEQCEARVGEPGKMPKIEAYERILTAVAENDVHVIPDVPCEARGGSVADLITDHLVTGYLASLDDVTPTDPRFVYAEAGDDVRCTNNVTGKVGSLIVRNLGSDRIDESAMITCTASIAPWAAEFLTYQIGDRSLHLDAKGNAPGCQFTTVHVDHAKRAEVTIGSTTLHETFKGTDVGTFGTLVACRKNTASLRFELRAENPPP